MTIHKAVIPAAGLGTRFLPATKATPKEMLPIVDKPAIQYVVEEAVAAGLEDLLMITGRGKRALEDHFDYNPELEASLGAKGDASLLAQVHQPTHLANVHFVRQGQALGLGHAVLCAKHHVGHEPFAVLLGDDLIDERDPILPTMLALQEHTGGSVVALLEVEPDEIHLTDALQTLAQLPAAVGGGVYGVVFRGRRYDTGDRLGYLKAVVQIAVDRADLGPDFRAWLTEFAAGLDD